MYKYLEKVAGDGSTDIRFVNRAMLGAYAEDITETIGLPKVTFCCGKTRQVRTHHLLSSKDPSL